MQPNEGPLRPLVILFGAYFKDFNNPYVVWIFLVLLKIGTTGKAERLTFEGK